MRATSTDSRSTTARPRGVRRILLAAAFAALVAIVPLATMAAGFTDLNAGSPHNDNINAIAAAGITRGCNPPDYTNYCPNDKVTREEMASFLARTAGLGGNAPVTNAKTAQTADTATNATNATNAAHATNADTAANATSATNATHATSADTAANSTHATNADTAANATAAGNASQLGGLAPGAYVQTSSAFIHRASASNTVGTLTYIDNPLTTGKPNALLFVTAARNPGGSAVVVNPHPIDVYYIGSGPNAKWAIVNADAATMPTGAAFNVLVVQP